MAAPAAAGDLRFLLVGLLVVVVGSRLVRPPDGGGIPTTLDGPFEPATRAFDRALRQGSDDVPLTDPRLAPRARPPAPEQIALAASSDATSVWVSWVTGEAQVGSHLTPLDPSTVRSEVWYSERPSPTAAAAGDVSGHYPHVARGKAEVYSQLYPYPGLLNYTSGAIHHVRLRGLRPATRYYYRCGDSSVRGGAGLSGELSFETLPSSAAAAYPRRVAVVGDLGLTGNSTSTVEHLARNDPSLVVVVGDMTYANQYRTTGGRGVPCFSCSFPDAPLRESYQPRWDGWGRFMEPLTSRIPMMVIEGNHEIEPQGQGGAVTFASYLARFAVPSEESGSNTKFYYSFNAGGIHFIMLGAYVDYNRTGAQYSWLEKDLRKIDRRVTPWVVAAWHPPWYNSYSSHYQEFECMRQAMEGLLYQHGVDIVFSGHVHAYERMNRVFNYTLDPCGPVYITIGDGGNIEKIDIDHADDPGKCPGPGDNHPEFGGVCHLNFTSGPAKGKFCWEKQPEWSAFRESSFGHGILEVVNSTYALWTWHRNQDAYGEDSVGDQIYIVRQPDKCLLQTTSASSENNCPSEGCPSLVSNSGYGAQKDIIRSGHLIWNASLVIWMILISTSSCNGAAHSALDLFVSSSKTVKVRPTCSLRMSSSAPVQPASFPHVGESVVVHPVWHRSGEIRNKRKRELELSAIASRTAVVQAPSTTLPISVQAANLESGEGSCDSYTSDAGTAKAGEDNVLHAANALTKVVPILQKRLSTYNITTSNPKPVALDNFG
uniref:Purple acid phosphatase n=1 Tax=Oryza rufipogon TaxID=4529 RepID=A0A0E0QGQ9_ORYRU